MATYYTLGLEPFKMAEVRGIHASKQIALTQAKNLENNKHPLSCQSYKVLTQTQVKKEKWELF
jgi:hypothetical protein